MGVCLGNELRYAGAIYQEWSGISATVAVGAGALTRVILKGSLDVGNFSSEGAIGVERTVFSDHRAPRDQDGNLGDIFDPVQSARNTSNFFGLSAEAQLGIGGKLALGIDLDELGQALECDLIVGGGG